MSKQMNLQGPIGTQIQNNNLDETVSNNVKKSYIQLEAGKSAITMQGGLVYPLMYKEILAGEKIKEYKIQNITRLITPLVPTMDKVYMNIKAFFVPHTRVWKDAEKFIAGKTEASSGNESQVNAKLPTYTMGSLSSKSTHTNLFRNTLAARYGLANNTIDTTINLLPIRGYRAIFNDFIRNKEYEEAHTEWNETIPTSNENLAVRATGGLGTEVGQLQDTSMYTVKGGQTRKTYYTNIKKNVITSEDETSPSELMDHIQWESKFQDLKQRVDNANKTDQEIIAEMGGTKVVRTDRVEYLGELDYELNYQQITQSTPTIDNSTPLGTTGSFSYTNVNGTLFREKEFLQHGYLHILVQLQVDKIYSEGTPKELLKTKVNEIYRPTLKNQQIQLMDMRELSPIGTQGGVAFQPPYAEYKRMLTLVSGDMRSQTLENYDNPEIKTVSNAQWHNMLQSNNLDQIGITRSYFRNWAEVNQVLARNNVLELNKNIYDDNGLFINDPIMVMSEHKVTTMLPIDEHTIKGKSSSNTTY